MVAVVADTHTIVWYLQGSEQLSPKASATLEQATAEGNPIYISAISVVEIAYLVERYQLPEVAFEQFLIALSDPDTGLASIPLDLAIVQLLPQIPREIVPDMPNRIIAATALLLDFPLVTCNQRMQALTMIQTIG